MQRDFQFKLPSRRAGPPTDAQSTTTTRGADASVSTDTSETRRKPGRPRGSGPRQRERAAAEAAAAQDSFDEPPDLGDESPPADHEPSPYSHRIDTSSSTGVARRVAPPQSSGPISSTPAASRIRKQPTSLTGSSRNHPRSSSIASARRTYTQEDEEEFGSQPDDVDDNSRDDSGSSAGPQTGILNASSEWDAGYAGMDESLPMIPSPAASSSHADASVRRMRPSVGGTSVSRLSIADSSHAHGDSPAARAAQRNLNARQQRRQGSPGQDRLDRKAVSSKDLAAKRRGRPPKSAAIPRSGIVVQIPSENDETVMDRTMVERQRGRPSASASVRPGREMQKRLRRALTLVFSASEAPDDADESGAPPSKKRKSVKYLNDVDIIWSVVDEELRSAIEEQPAKAPFLALKALRKSVRTNFLNLSEKTDNRTTLISQLLRARKQKRQLRKEVFAKRSELTKSTIEASERQKEMKDWRKEVTVSMQAIPTWSCNDDIWLTDVNVCPLVVRVYRTSAKSTPSCSICDTRPRLGTERVS